MRVHNWKHAVPFVAPEKSEPALQCDEGVVKCLYIDPGQKVEPHVHSKSIDVIVIVQGTGVATVDGKECSVGPGDVILNPPGTVHGIRNDGNERVVWLVIQSPPPNRNTTLEGADRRIR